MDDTSDLDNIRRALSDLLANLSDPDRFLAEAEKKCDEGKEQMLSFVRDVDGEMQEKMKDLIESLYMAFGSSQPGSLILNAGRMELCDSFKSMVLVLSMLQTAAYLGYQAGSSDSLNELDVDELDLRKL